MDLNDFIHENNKEVQLQDHKVAQFLDYLLTHLKITVNITIEGAAGYTMLGILIVKFADVLQKEATLSRSLPKIITQVKTHRQIRLS